MTYFSLARKLGFLFKISREHNVNILVTVVYQKFYSDNGENVSVFFYTECGVKKLLIFSMFFGKTYTFC